MRKLVLTLFLSFCGLFGMQEPITEKEMEICSCIDTLLIRMDNNRVEYESILQELYVKCATLELEYRPTSSILRRTFKNQCLKRKAAVGNMVLLSKNVAESIHRKLLRLIVNVLLELNG